MKIDGELRCDIKDGVLRIALGIGEILEIPHGVHTIAPNAFASCKVKYIIIPKSIKRIDTYAFAECSALENVEIPLSVKSIGCEAFRNCISLKKVKIPLSVELIGYGAFRGCRELENIIIPRRVSTIEDAAFMSCYKLEHIRIPDSVRTIIGMPFAGCVNLKRVVFEGADCRFYNVGFWRCPALEELILPPKCKLRPDAFNEQLVPKGLCASLSTLHRHLSDGDLVVNLLKYPHFFGDDAIAEILLTRLKTASILQGKDRKEYYRFFVIDGKYAEVLLKRLPHKSTMKMRNSVACALLLFADKASIDVLRQIFQWLKTQKNNEKALAILNKNVALLNQLN